MRAFIAAEIPEDIKERLAELQASFKAPGLVPVRPEAMHLTLHFFAEISDGAKDDISRAMESSKTTRFTVKAEGVSFFTPRQVKVIFASITDGKAELVNLYNTLGKNLERNGIRLTEERAYTPHLTLFRVRGSDNRALLELIKNLETAEVGSFIVDRIFLIKSVLTSEGPVYTDLHITELD